MTFKIILQLPALHYAAVTTRYDDTLLCLFYGKKKKSAYTLKNYIQKESEEIKFRSMSIITFP